MKKSDEEMLKLIEEQKANAERLAEEMSDLSGNETDRVLVLDALACAGLRIVPLLIFSPSIHRHDTLN